MNKQQTIRAILVAAVFIFCGCRDSVHEYKPEKDLYDYVEPLAKQIKDSLQRDNIAMDNFGKENLNQSQVIVYNTNCKISIAIDNLLLKCVGVKITNK